MSLLGIVGAARVLCEPTRWRILLLLRNREWCVCDLEEMLAISQSTLSTHLQVIRKARWVRVRRNGRWAYYSLAPAWVNRLEQLIQIFTPDIASDLAWAKRTMARRSQSGELDAYNCCDTPPRSSP